MKGCGVAGLILAGVGFFFWAIGEVLSVMGVEFRSAGYYAMRGCFILEGLFIFAALAALSFGLMKAQSARARGDSFDRDDRRDRDWDDRPPRPDRPDR